MVIRAGQVKLDGHLSNGITFFRKPLCFSSMASNSTATGPDYVSVVTGFLLNFTATVLGVIIAFYISLRHEREKDRAEKALAKQRQEAEIALTKDRTIQAIRLELEENLKDAEKIGASPLVNFRTGAYQSAIASGTLSLFDPKIQTILSTTYLRIRKLELISQKLVSMAGASTTLTDFDQSLNWFKMSFDAEKNGVMADIREA